MSTEEQKEIINNLPHLKPDFSLLEKTVEYGAIKNLNTEFYGINNRIGDYGIDNGRYLYCYTKYGWQLMNPSDNWKKKYEELKAQIENKKA